jgi:hypothetical protein
MRSVIDVMRSDRKLHSFLNVVNQQKPRVVVALLCLFTLVLLHADYGLAHSEGSPVRAIEHINTVVNELSSQLQVSAQIRVTIASANNRMISVEHLGNTRTSGAFVLCFDETFLTTLDDDELRAAVAHELGHVWIFSHHPYLQTEALANEIAMRVVSRSSLERVYQKLWVHLGISGNVDEILTSEKNGLNY